MFSPTFGAHGVYKFDVRTVLAGISLRGKNAVCFYQDVNVCHYPFAVYHFFTLAHLQYTTH